MTMECTDPGTGGREELLAAIEKNDARKLCEAMIAAALNVDDWEWLQDEFVELLHHPEDSRLHGHGARRC